MSVISTLKMEDKRLRCYTLVFPPRTTYCDLIFSLSFSVQDLLYISYCRDAYEIKSDRLSIPSHSTHTSDIKV
jgi:hypothetical protein